MNKEIINYYEILNFYFGNCTYIYKFKIVFLYIRIRIY